MCHQLVSAGEVVEHEQQSTDFDLLDELADNGMAFGERGQILRLSERDRHPVR